MILPTSISSGTAHASGLSDLLQLHSPEAYSSGPSHRIFIGLRPAIVGTPFLHLICQFDLLFINRVELDYPRNSEKTAHISCCARVEDEAFSVCQGKLVPRSYDGGDCTSFHLGRYRRTEIQLARLKLTVSRLSGSQRPSRRFDYLEHNFPKP